MEGVSKDACQANLDVYMNSSSTLLLIHPVTSSQAYLPKTALFHLIISFNNLKFGQYWKRKMVTTLVAAGELGWHHPGGLRPLPPTGSFHRDHCHGHAICWGRGSRNRLQINHWVVHHQSSDWQADPYLWLCFLTPIHDCIFCCHSGSAADIPRQ